MIFYQPSILPETFDPEGSIRYENVNITLEEIPEAFEETKFYDDIENKNRFIIEQHSPSFREYQARMFKGTVLHEQNDNYSWWRNVL